MRMLKSAGSREKNHSNRDSGGSGEHAEQGKQGNNESRESQTAPSKKRIHASQDSTGNEKGPGGKPGPNG